MRKLVVALMVVLVAFVTVPAEASGGDARHRLPSMIDLPEGFFPEGIAVGDGATFYVSSLADGSIYRGDLRTGEGDVLTVPTGAFTTIGLAVDRYQRVWAAGGPTGQARVYDGHTGSLLATFALTGPAESFINDVIVTGRAAWLTDSGTEIDPDPGSFQFPGKPRLFKVPLGRGGQLPDQSAVEELPVPSVPDVAFPNLNGVETSPDGRRLIVAHSTLGTLYSVDPSSGAAQEVDLGVDPGPEGPFARPDGLVRRGEQLHVVEPGAARFSTVRLDGSGTRGSVVRSVPVPGAESPTTAALYRGGIYLVDARFFTMTGPYQVTRVSLSCRPVRTTGEGEAAPPQPGDPDGLIRTVARIRSGLLRGTTEAAFTTVDLTPPVLTFAGELTFTTVRGTLTVGLAGTLDVVTGEFEASGPVIGSTGGLEGAAGTVVFAGVQDLADPAGSFTETVTGEICVDLGPPRR